MRRLLERYGESLTLLLFGAGILAIWQYMGEILV